jgi:hypothetical protein
MSQKTLFQDSNFEWDKNKIIDAYKKAAEYDDFLFGDFDYSDIWLKENEQEGH